MLNVMSDLEFTFIRCEQHKGWRSLVLGIHIQNDCGVAKQR